MTMRLWRVGEGNELATAGQRDRIIEFAPPAPIANAATRSCRTGYACRLAVWGGWSRSLGFHCGHGIPAQPQTYARAPRRARRNGPRKGRMSAPVGGADLTGLQERERAPLGYQLARLQ
jgi:hypothetical protein